METWRRELGALGTKTLTPKPLDHYLPSPFTLPRLCAWWLQAAWPGAVDKNCVRGSCNLFCASRCFPAIKGIYRI